MRQLPTSENTTQMKEKNPHLQRHILKTETYHELMNSRIHKHTRKSLNSKLGGLSKGMKHKPMEEEKWKKDFGTTSTSTWSRNVLNKVLASVCVQ